MHKDVPTECPFHISYQYTVPVQLTATVPAATFIANQFVATVISWATTAVTGTSVTTTWDVSGTPWIIVASGTYQAGTAGFSGGVGYDNLYAQFYTSPGPFPQAIATARLSYSYEFPDVEINAPAAIGSGVPFVAHAAISDVEIVPPVSYAWTVNGSPVSGSTADVTLSGPSSGSMSIGVQITDASSTTRSASWNVDSCPNNQITC